MVATVGLAMACSAAAVTSGADGVSILTDHTHSIGRVIGYEASARPVSGVPPGIDTANPG